jgi:CHRD domain
MRSRIALVALAVTALAFVGCGSSSSTSSTKSSSSPSTAATPAPSPSITSTTTNAAVKARAYTVSMKGSNEVPKGAPNGSATAVITIKTSKQVCWKFTNLKGVTAPKVDHIHQGPAGVAGSIVIPLGTAYKPSGCVPASATLLSQIESNPSGFYVNIHNVAYPQGVVRGQL